MWCDKCQADVAATASHDNHRLFCASCGSEMPVPSGDGSKNPPALRSAKPVRDARELLARWAQEDERDPFETPAAWSPKATVPHRANETATSPRPQGDAQLRFDGSHSAVRPAPAFVEMVPPQSKREAGHPVPPSAPVADVSRQDDLIIHAAHQIAAPHFQPEPIALADKSTRWVALVGQMFAYLGVGTLTVGAVLVLMGYFGDTPSHSSTGWLVTTAGQMLLMLGVVTLISGGMEQTTQEVARRIDTIGERIGRIERMTVGSNSSPSQSDEADRK